MREQTPEATSFMDAARPVVPDLLAAATHHIGYHQAIGDLVDEFSPEELVGETLVRACDQGARRPTGVSLRSWLLTLEMRTMGDLTARRTEERKFWSFSFDEPIPSPTATELDDSFWDWYQPDEPELTMADEFADSKIVSPEAREALKDDTGWLAKVDTLTWRAWLLHEVHDLPLVEVTSSLRLTENEARHRISEAWSVYRRSTRS